MRSEICRSCQFFNTQGAPVKTPDEPDKFISAGVVKGTDIKLGYCRAPFGLLLPVRAETTGCLWPPKAVADKPEVKAFAERLQDNEEVIFQGQKAENNPVASELSSAPSVV